jgi:hypothetical protein
VTIRAAYVQRTDGAIELGPRKSRASLRQVALPKPVVQMHRDHLDVYVHDNPDALVAVSLGGPATEQSGHRDQTPTALTARDCGPIPPATSTRCPDPPDLLGLK